MSSGKERPEEIVYILVVLDFLINRKVLEKIEFIVKMREVFTHSDLLLVFFEERICIEMKM